MKKNFLLPSLLIFTNIYIAFSQTNPASSAVKPPVTPVVPTQLSQPPQAAAQTVKIIEFDFATKKISSLTPLSDIKPGDYVSMHITNLNPYLYQAKVAFTDSNVSINTAPALFSSYFNSADISSLVANLGSSILKIFPPAKPTSPGGAPIRAPTTQQQIIITLSTEMGKLKTKLGDYQIDLTGLVQVMQAFIFQTELRLIIIKQWSIRQGDVKDFDSAEKAQFIKTLDSIIDKKNTIGANFINAVQDYEANTLTYGKNIQDDASLKKADSLLKVTSKDLIAALSSFDTTYSYSKFADILSQLINIQRDNFEYMSFPAQIKGDLTTVDVSVSPWSPTSTLSSYKGSWQYPLAPPNYFNFSMDFYISGLHADNYFANTKVSGTDTTYIISKENSSQVELGISALFHYGLYIGKSKATSFQFCFGPGISIQKSPQPRLLAGFGAGFGRKNKIMLNVGVIAGEVQTIRDYYKNNPVVTFPPSDLTVGVLKANIFFSVGYMIF